VRHAPEHSLLHQGREERMCNSASVGWAAHRHVGEAGDERRLAQVRVQRAERLAVPLGHLGVQVRAKAQRELRARGALCRSALHVHSMGLPPGGRAGAGHQHASDKSRQGLRARCASPLCHTLHVVHTAGLSLASHSMEHL
jgi:hypothetical protein